MKLLTFIVLACKAIDMKTLSVLLFLGSSITTYGDDILTLKGNLKFSGEIIKIKKCIIHFRTSNYIYYIPASDINSIEFEYPNNKARSRYLTVQDSNKCVLGRTDANKYHGKEAGHFALGFLLGPWAILGAAVANPTPEKSVDTINMSENHDLFYDPTYLKCYKKKAIAQNVTFTSIGFGVFLAFYVATIISGN